MRVFKFAAIGAVALTMGLAGCSQTPQQQRATTGAAVGGVGGALVGQAIGRDTKSTLIGAGAGALLGAVVATSGGPQPGDRQMCRYRAPNGQVYVAECDERYYSGRY